MTYLVFLVIFVCAPSLLFFGVGCYLDRFYANGKRDLGWHWRGVAALAAIALVWTTPWDNFIVASGVWTYGVDRVVAVIGYVPIEEYAFFVLMPVYNGALFFCLYKLFAGVSPGARGDLRNSRFWTVTVGGLIMIMAALLFFFSERFFYLATTLLWFVPPLMVQWFFDAPCLMRNRRLIFFSTILPTLYFCVADYFAIEQGVWTISDPTRTGWDLLGLPFEEAFFFFIVSLLLSQGMVLWHRLRLS
jgi:lycopene cyclase domain-containing protein